MKNKRIQMMAIDGLFIAILTIFTFTNLGFIVNGTVALTTIPIFVFIVGYLFGWKRGLIYGTAFGVLSLIRALTSANIDYFFINPLISVLPRAIFGLLAGLFGKMISKLPLKFSSWLIFIYVIVLSLLHAVMVLTMLGLFNPTIWPFFGAIIATNTILETIIYVVSVPLIIAGVQPGIKRLNLN